MSKYQRQQPSISRNCDANSSEDNWLQQIKQNLEKDAVQPKSVDQSLFHQINTIMNGTKSKYHSVQEAVDDMKVRSGLTSYLKQSAAEHKEKMPADYEECGECGFDHEYSPAEAHAWHKEHHKKTASDNNAAIEKTVDLQPTVIKKFPAIKTTLENYIKSSRGNLPVPAIIEKIKSIHRSDISDSKDWDDDNFLRLVSQLNLQAKVDNPANYQNNSNLGKNDHLSDADISASNTDAFNVLNPAKY